MRPSRRLPSHLHGLPRDPETGWPAPYVNAWSSEIDNENGWTIGNFDGRAAAMMPSSRGVGTVNFKLQHMNRQRDLVVSRQCQVCRRPKANVLVIGPNLSGQHDVIQGVRYALFTEPFLCRRCADFVLDHCPGLIRRRRAEKLAAFEPKTHQVVLSNGTHDILSPTVPIILWAKIAIPLNAFPQPTRDTMPGFEPDYGTQVDA